MQSLDRSEHFLLDMALAGFPSTNLYTSASNPLGLDREEHKSPQELAQSLNAEVSASSVEQPLNPFAQVPPSPQFIEQVIRNLPGVVYLFDAIAQRSVYLSPQAAELLGYSVNGVMAMGANFVATIMHPEDFAQFPRHLEQLERAQPSDLVEFKYRMRHANGEWRWFASQDRVFHRTAAGQLHQVLGFAQDITECKRIEDDRKQAEEALRQSRDLHETVFNASSDALFLVDPEILRTVDCNQRAVELFEASGKEELIGIEGHTLQRQQFTPNELDAIVADMDKGVWIKEIEYVTRQGNYFWGNLAAKSIPFGERNVHLVRITDVTDGKQAEAALLQSQAQLQQQLAEIEAIYQSAPIGLNVLDTDLRFVRINQRLAEMNGLPVEAHIGRTLREVLPNVADAAEQLLRPILETGEPLLNVEISGETPAQPGVQRIWLEHFLPLKNGDRIIGISTVCEEITERKRIEDDRQQAEEALRQSEAQLRQQTEQLAQANRIKDEFLAVLSHELRTPLNPILGWSKLLQTRNFSQEQARQALSTIERNAKLQVQLIDDLLDISRIIRGKLTLNCTPVSLLTPIAAAIETVHQVAWAKSIAIETMLNPTLRQVSGDAGRLQQVVWNLLLNAIKFTPEGGRVTVRLEQVEHYAQIQVSDTGKGIHPDFLPHLFEMFRQQDSSTTRQFGGLGLGLAISGQLVEAHGGTISAASAGEGEGATFTVRLPLIPASQSVVPEPPSVHQSLSLQGIQVLVVDDETDTLQFLQVLLEQEGAIVTTVTSAQTALDVMAQSSIDVLVSDIQMPQMDGYALIHQVRSLPQLGNLPAIALTAYAYESDRERLLAAGYQQHLAKPINPHVLIGAIAELVHHNNLTPNPFPTREGE
jgi:PAS domain S-box-containing protein